MKISLRKPRYKFYIRRFLARHEPNAPEQLLNDAVDMLASYVENGYILDCKKDGSIDIKQNPTS